MNKIRVVGIDMGFMVRRLNRPFLRARTIDRSVACSQIAGINERLRAKMPVLLYL